MRLHWFSIFLLLTAGLVLVHYLPAWKDVEFGDEITYLGSGLTFSIPFKGGAQWGPLYAAWYAFWHFFIANSLNLYYFNWALLSILAGFTVFVFLRSFGTSLAASTWVTILFLFSNQNLPLNPKISIAPFCLILAIVSLIHLRPWSNSRRFLAISLGGLLCAYCRPEFYVSFLFAFLLAGFWLWKEKALVQQKTMQLLGVFGIVVIGLHLLFGNPLFTGDDNRSTVAFQQHFVVNYCAWTHQPEPSTIKAQLELFHKVLGANVDSPTDALKMQPTWAFKHITTNIVNTLTANLKNLIDIFYQTVFRGWHSPWRIAVAAGIILAFLLLIDYKTTWRNLRQKPVDWWGFMALIVLLIPTLIATVLIYPRTHYLVFHLILAFWIIAFFINRLSFRTIAAFKPFSPAFLSLLLLSIFITIRFPEYHRIAATPTADNVRFVTQLHPKERLRVLERDWYRVFLKEESDWIHVEEYTDGDFVKFVQQKNINFILMTHDMQSYFSKDAGFASFLNQYKSEGFVKLQTNPEGDYLFIKQSIL
ncbi:hypothetical protein [Runella sp.]|uniref:hypothetical protein n=1 Tax=Runella sp. TaxID=1960881 RepID=UPI003D0B10C2